MGRHAGDPRDRGGSAHAHLSPRQRRHVALPGAARPRRCARADRHGARRRSRGSRRQRSSRASSSCSRACRSAPRLWRAGSRPSVPSSACSSTCSGSTVTPRASSPYTDRRTLLEQLALAGPTWQTPPATIGDGETVFRAAQELDMEGVVAKRLDSTYQPGRRSDAWRKVKTYHGQEFVVGGWLPGAGRLEGRLGSLLVGYYEDGKLRYAGRVGSGLDERKRSLLEEKLAPLARDTSPFDRTPKLPDPHWVEPELVVEVRFQNWTSAGILRAPRYRGCATTKTRPRWYARSGRARVAAADDPRRHGGARSRRPDRGSSRCAPSPTMSARCRGMVNDTISSRPIVSNPNCSAARAPSLAYPLPQWSRASRHPTSTAGVNGASKVVRLRPMNPMHGRRREPRLPRARTRARRSVPRTSRSPTRIRGASWCSESAPALRDRR